MLNKISIVFQSYREKGLTYVLKKIWIKLYSATPFGSMTTMRLNGFRLYLFPTLLTCNLFADKGYRDENDIVIINILREGDIVVDVGANIGSLTILMSSLVGKTGAVYSFEPSLKFFIYLDKNIQLNKFTNIKIFNCALGEKNGFEILNESVLDDTAYKIDENSYMSGRSVEVRMLDSIIEDKCIVRLIKIDVEGYEKNVLLGSKAVLQRTEIIYLEFSTEVMREAKVKPQELLSVLQENFDVYTCDTKTLCCDPFVYRENKEYSTDLLCVNKNKNVSMEKFKFRYAKKI